MNGHIEHLSSDVDYQAFGIATDVFVTVTCFVCFMISLYSIGGACFGSSSAFGKSKFGMMNVNPYDMMKNSCMYSVIIFIVSGVATALSIYRFVYDGQSDFVNIIGEVTEQN